MNKTYKLALFGDPVSHSLSPKIHKLFASQFSIDIGYTLIQVGEKWFADQVNSFFESGGHGANITLPYKSNAVDIVTDISDSAKIAKTVNTLSINTLLVDANPDSESVNLCGDNTDGVGFVNDLKNRCGFNCKDKKILILGAGGAAHGIVPSIMQQDPAHLFVANRTITKAKAICTYENSKALTFAQLNKLKESFDLIVHSSSLGHEGTTLEFSQHHTHNKTICYDLSYSKAAKPFLKFSKSMGVTVLYDGLGMLIEQAAGSFEIWFGKKPNTALVLKEFLIDAESS